MLKCFWKLPTYVLNLFHVHHSRVFLIPERGAARPNYSVAFIGWLINQDVLVVFTYRLALCNRKYLRDSLPVVNLPTISNQNNNTGFATDKLCNALALPTAFALYEALYILVKCFLNKIVFIFYFFGLLWTFWDPTNSVNSLIRVHTMAMLMKLNKGNGICRRYFDQRQTG